MEYSSVVTVNRSRVSSFRVTELVPFIVDLVSLNDFLLLFMTTIQFSVASGKTTLVTGKYFNDVYLAYKLPMVF